MLTAGARHRAGGGNGGGNGNGNGSCTSGRRGSGGGGGGSGSGGESSGSEAQGGQLLWGRGVAERSVPFDKLYLTRQILAGGGTIYDTFEEMKVRGWKRTSYHLLHTNLAHFFVGFRRGGLRAHLRHLPPLGEVHSGRGRIFFAFCFLFLTFFSPTPFLSQSLAAGIPIYSHLWIIDSCKAGRLIGDRDAYLLPAGFSIITHSISADK